MITGKAKIVRAFAAAAAALLLFLLPREGKGADGSPLRAASAFLDLIPDITRGLDLVPPSSSGSGPALGRTLTVWNGSEAVTMDLEEYIIGVTAAEMPASYELEALKAQAVAARTFTVKHMVGDLRCKSGCTVCTDAGCCQAFISVDGMRKNWGKNFDKYYEKIRSAVISTEGQVLTNEGELVTALYHSSSGGRTEDCEAVFAVALPYLVSVESDGEEDSPEYMAVKTFSNEDFMRIINEKFPDAGMTDPEADIDVWQRTDSGRIALIRLGGTVRTGQQLRKALGLHSTNAEFAFSNGKVKVTCYGYGHGVGMSQVGANAMARRGADYVEILKHYYTGVEIEHFGEAGEFWRLLVPGK